MDTTNTEFQVEQPELVVTNDAKYYLNTAARWANFLGILGFIFTGFTVLSALSWLVMGGAMTAMSSQQPESMPPIYGAFMSIMSSVGSIVFLIYAVVLFFFSFYLVRFAGSTKRAVLYGSAVDLAKGLQGLKSFFKLWGIVSIIVIALSVLGFIGLILFAIGTHAAAN
jgi:hypothetical protein